MHLYVTNSYTIISLTVPAIWIAFIVMQGVYQLFVVLLNDNTYWQELLTVIVFAIIGIVVVLKLRVSENWGQQIALFFGIGHIFVALMQPKGILQPSLLSSLLFITLYFIIPYWQRTKQEIHITEENK